MLKARMVASVIETLRAGSRRVKCLWIKIKLWDAWADHMGLDCLWLRIRLWERLRLSSFKVVF